MRVRSLCDLDLKNSINKEWIQVNVLPTQSKNPKNDKSGSLREQKNQLKGRNKIDLFSNGYQEKN